MPIMQVYYPEDALDDAPRPTSAQRLTDVADRHGRRGRHMGRPGVRLGAVHAGQARRLVGRRTTGRPFRRSARALPGPCHHPRGLHERAAQERGARFGQCRGHGGHGLPG